MHEYFDLLSLPTSAVASIMRFLVIHDDPIRRLDDIASLRWAGKAFLKWADAGLMNGMRMKPLTQLEPWMFDGDGIDLEKGKGKGKGKGTVLDLSLHSSTLENISIECVEDIEVLRAQRCAQLEWISLKGLSHLRTVDVVGCEKSVYVNITECSLRSFEVSGACNGLLCLEKVTGMSSLDLCNFRGLQIYECDDVEHIGPDITRSLHGFTNPRGIYMYLLPKLTTVELVPYMNLTNVNIDMCAMLETLDLSGLARLEKCVVKRCDKLKFLDLSRCVSLRQLVIVECDSLVTTLTTGCSRLGSS